MKRKHFIIISLVFIVLSLISLGYYYVQKSTEYRQIAGVKYYNSKDIYNLAVLSKVWGYLKYYHPSVVEGNYNWDDELVKMLPKILKSTNKDERNKILSEWVTSLGEFKQDTLPEIKPDSVKMYPDLDWIKDRKELGALSIQLEKIKTAKRPYDQSYFVEFKKETGNPVFVNEESYPEMSYPSVSYRLLSLFRYWNIIQYYYPYKYLIGENWQNVLPEFIPQFINAKNELEYKLISLKLIARIHDSHAILFDKALEKYKGDYIVPLYVSFIEGKPVVTDTLISSSEKNYPLKIGDIILKINGKPVENIILEQLPYIPGSNLSSQLNKLSYELMRGNAKSINVTFKRGNDVLSKDMTCYPMSSQNFRFMAQKNKALYRLISKEKKIGYLYLGSSIGGTVPDFSNTKGLIIDLRCYPNIKKIKGYLNIPQLYKKPVKFANLTSTNYLRPGLFKCFEECYTNVFKDISSDHFVKTAFYKGKVILLINEITESHAEFMAMMYRCSPTATIIGSTTAGADGDVSIIPLPGNMQTTISGLGVYYPDGRETQRVGIVPDIVVKPTIKGIREGKDEVMERAIELITKKEIISSKTIGK